MDDHSKILLTGARGLVGRGVARKLGLAGRAYVAIDQTNSGSDGHDVIACDVRDTHKLHDLASEHTFDAIIHCAGYSGPMLGQDNPAAVIAVNVGGTANLLELARIHRIPRFVFCSSVSAVGPTSAATTEDIVPRPTTVYGASKAACEDLITAYERTTDITTVSLRLSAVWGPERTTACALGTMIKNASTGRTTIFDNGGDFPTQYLHVDDAAAALILAVDVMSPAQHIFNINGGEYETLAAIAERVRSAIPGAHILLGPGGDPTYDWQEPFRIDAAKHHLGFEPRVSLAQGIDAFVNAITDPSHTPTGTNQAKASGRPQQQGN